MSTTATDNKTETQVGAQSDLLALLLQDQQELSAVERFSESHQPSCLIESQPTYESLLPLTPLQTGEQYAFSVDLDRCSGCKACVVACHSLNGLDENEAWRDVGLLYAETQTLPVMQHVTSACHHCVNPACLNACPTNSYEKDPLTGIVRHLDDQCFGCQYCTLACPYGVPKYSEQKGIVRKCDMCSQRLANNEAPACVQSCPHEAISITKVATADAEEKAEQGVFLSGAHQPSYTVPTTVYHSSRLTEINLSSKKDSSQLVRGDDHDLHPEHAHWPLILMLTLIQLSVGIFLGIGLLNLAGNLSIESTRWIALIGFGISQAALGFATLHLGRPLYMFRGILGFTHSWMSREIVAFGLYSGAAGTYLASLWAPVGWFPFAEVVQQLGPWGAVGTGYLGLFCSMKIYQCTQREYWNTLDTSLKFAGTTVVTGIAFLLMGLPLSSAALGIETSTYQNIIPVLALGLAVSIMVKLAIDLRLLWAPSNHLSETLQKSARIMQGPLKNVLLLRAGTAGAVMAIGLLDFAMASSASPMMLTFLGAVLLGISLIGELAERYLFFAAVVAPKMPRGIA